MANGLQLFHIHTKHFQFLPGKRLYLPDSVCQLNQEKRFQEGFLWAASRRCALAPQARELASLQVEQESELAAQSAERTEGRGWVRSPLPRSCPTGSSVCWGRKNAKCDRWASATCFGYKGKATQTHCRFPGSIILHKPLSTHRRKHTQRSVRHGPRTWRFLLAKTQAEKKTGALSRTCFTRH